MFTKNKTKFNWLAQESAPREFPMRVIDGTFYYHGEDSGLYIPTAASISKGWGEGSSVHVVGDTFKPLPDQLNIRFFSFWENKLYRGSFDLPYEKILALFKEGVQEDKENPKFRYIVAGMAPGGAVAVWVSGQERREVFFGQAEPYEQEIKTVLGGPIKDRAAYADSYLKGLPEDVYNRIKKEGVPFGLWEKYRKKFSWSFAAPPETHISSFDVSFYNAERYSIDTPFVSDYGPKPIPRNLSFISVFPNEKTKYVYSIELDFFETLEVMEKLSAGENPVNLVIAPRLPETDSTLSLSNGKETIVLKKIIHH